MTGYDKVDDIQLEYPKNYRSNQRMIFINDNLAATLWKRIQKHISTKDIFNGISFFLRFFSFFKKSVTNIIVSPIGYCSSGCWIPVGLNEGFIIVFYSFFFLYRQIHYFYI